MRDCPNAAMRELLPDLINDRLTAHERADVHAHLNTCADCRAELQLLERVRASVQRTPVDVARIVAAVPAYKKSRWHTVAASPLLRAAAVIVIALGGALLLRQDDAQVVDSVPVTPSDTTPTVVATQPTPTAPAPTQRNGAATSSELAMGEMFEDLTDSELEALLQSMGTIEAVTPVETEVVPPAVNREGV
jgi:hypothetical protein